MKEVQTVEEIAVQTQTAEPTPAPAQTPGRRKILLAALVILASLLLLFLSNDWQLRFTARTGVTRVSYPASYEAPPVTATLSGKWLFRDGVSMPTKRIGTVDDTRVGHYWTVYRADFLFWNAAFVQEVVVADNTAPKLRLVPETRAYVLPNLPYDDPGFTAEDDVDGDLTDRVIAVERDGVLSYTVTDLAGNRAKAARLIPYDDPIPPAITLLGDPQTIVDMGGVFEEPGFSAEDNVDGDLTEQVTVSGAVNTASPGYYTLTYTVEDSYHNVAIAARTVLVRGYTVSPAPAPSWSGGGELPDKTIFLTFDDGPCAYTNELLDILAEYNVKATFFVVKGNHTASEMDIITREAEEGHTVAIHSYSHDYKKIYASERAYFEDLAAINEIIYEKTGNYSSLIRFPGGSSNTSSHFNPGIMTRLTAKVEEAGYHYFDWNVVSGDAGETTSSDAVFTNVINGCKDRDVSIVLQHDIKKFSIDAVERIIQWGLANGYTFLPLTPDCPGAHHRVNN